MISGVYFTYTGYNHTTTLYDLFRVVSTKRQKLEELIFYTTSKGGKTMFSLRKAVKAMFRLRKVVKLREDVLALQKDVLALQEKVAFLEKYHNFFEIVTAASKKDVESYVKEKLNAELLEGGYAAFVDDQIEYAATEDITIKIFTLAIQSMLQDMQHAIKYPPNWVSSA